jgi:hypothetical protein
MGNLRAELLLGSVPGIDRQKLRERMERDIPTEHQFVHMVIAAQNHGRFNGEASVATLNQLILRRWAEKDNDSIVRLSGRGLELVCEILNVDRHHFELVTTALPLRVHDLFPDMKVRWWSNGMWIRGTVRCWVTPDGKEPEADPEPEHTTVVYGSTDGGNPFVLAFERLRRV